jgi:hypothetical protein
VVAGPIVAVLIAWLVTGRQGGSEGGAHVPGEPRPGRVEIAQWEWRNLPPRYRPTGVTDVQTRETTPTLDLTLLNHSNRTVLVRRAKADILDSAAIYTCATQGGGPVAVSARVDVPLPAVPRQSERAVSHTLHQQIGPNGVLRVQLRFAKPREAHSAFELHRVRLRLETTQRPSGTVDLGTLLVATPGPPSVLSSEQFPAAASPFGDGLHARRMWRTVSWCGLRNRDAVARMFRSTARRSRHLDGLASLAASPGPAPTWEPVKPAVERLLSGTGMEPLFAVLAAEFTSDDTYSSAVRKRAARALLDLSREQFAQPTHAAAQAREALELEPLPGAESVIVEADAAIDEARASSSHLAE